MPIGGLLRDRDSQYVAHRDDTTGTWRILDAWDDALGEFEPDADIPDDHDAVTILSEGAYHSLLKEAARLGILSGAAHAENYNLREYSEDLEQKIEQLEKEIKEYSSAGNTPRSSANDLDSLSATSFINPIISPPTS